METLHPSSFLFHLMLYAVFTGDSSSLHKSCTFVESELKLVCAVDDLDHFPRLSSNVDVFNSIAFRGNRKMVAINEGVLDKLRTKSLFITGTNADTLDCNLFQGHVESLEQLHLSNNALLSVPECALKHLQNVRVLNLRGNKIRVVSVISFNGLLRLLHLDLSDNNISFIPPSSFDGLHMLRTLKLSKNGLKELPIDFLKGNDKLKILDISFNKLIALDGLSSSRTNLLFLNLSRNGLKELPIAFLKGYDKLKILDISFNKLIALDGLSSSRCSFKTLDVSYNWIPEIRDVSVIAASDFTFNLQNNRIRNVNNLTIRVHEKENLSVRLNIASNDMVKPPDIHLFKNSNTIVGIILDISNNRIQNLDKLNLRIWDHVGSSMSTVDLMLTLIGENNGIWNLPECDFFFEYQFKLLDLSRNYISGLTQWWCLIRRVKELVLDFNRVQHLPGLRYRTDNILEKLSLTGNRIHHIWDDAFKGLGNLKEVKLDQNNIKFIPLALLRLPSMTSLFIATNPLDCSCEKNSGDNYLGANILQDKATCKSPNDLRGFLWQCTISACLGPPLQLKTGNNVCEADNFLESDIMIDPSTVGFNVSWKLYGPGTAGVRKIELTVYKYQLSLLTSIRKRIVHPDNSYYVFHDLESLTSYRFCIGINWPPNNQHDTCDISEYSLSYINQKYTVIFLILFLFVRTILGIY